MATGTLGDLVKAGAIGQLCRMYHRGKDDPRIWERIREFAGREFRSFDPAVIDQLVQITVTSVANARRIGGEC
jgi:hypothetical protein